MTVRLEGSVTLPSAAEVRTRLLEALARGGPLIVDCAAVEEADLSLVQLLVAARRHAARSGAGFRLEPPPSPAVVALFERAGLPLPDPT